MSDSAAPPLAKTVAHRFVHNGQEFSDPYAWLQNKQDPEVLAYLQAENEYSQAMLSHTAALQEQLLTELRGRLPASDADVPQRRGGYLYYTRVERGKQYRLICRKADQPDAVEEVLLDENALAEGKNYCRIFRVEPSPDQSLIAYLVDTTGAMVFDLYVQETRSGAMVGEPISNTAWTMAWAGDSRTLFYTAFDHAHRSHQLWRQRVGEQRDSAVLVHHEPDETFSVYVNNTRSGAFLLLNIQSHTASEVHFLRADRPEQTFQVIQPRQPWLEYAVDHHGDRFLILTNDGAENFKLMETATATPSKEYWSELIPHQSDTFLEEMDLFRDHLVIYQRRGGVQQIRVSAPDGVSQVTHVAFPEPVYTVTTSLRNDPFRANPEFDSNVLRFNYSSLTTPLSTIDYSLNNGAWTVMKQQKMESSYDQTLYTSERIYASAADGARVPISLVYRKGARRESGNPLLLYAYGSYGYSLDPSFNARLLSLLDRGFVFALAHIRGGSELGRAWYEQGRLLHKKNSFTDFIACAEELISQGYTTPAQLAMRGRSAGGLLMGAVSNMRPELFAAVVAEVPFMNVISAILMPDLPLTVTEYEQWGNPARPEEFDYMLSYSPYENLEAKNYPAIFATGGLNDLQVPYWDPAKWVARLRATKTDANPLLLTINMGAGHGGASGRYDSLTEEARVYAFLIDRLGAPHYLLETHTAA